MLAQFTQQVTTMVVLTIFQRSRGLFHRASFLSLRSCHLGTTVSNVISSSEKSGVALKRQAVVFENRSCMLSTATESVEEKPIIPGIGKGKTSTGLVSFSTGFFELSRLLLFLPLLLCFLQRG